MPAFALPLPPELLADWYGREGDAVAMAEIPRMCASQPIAEDVLSRCGADAARVPLVALRGTIELVSTTSFVDRLTGLTVPTLVVGGRNDVIFTPRLSRRAWSLPSAVPGWSCSTAATRSRSSSPGSWPH